MAFVTPLHVLLVTADSPRSLILLSDHNRVLNRHSCFGNAGKVFGCFFFFNCEQYRNAVFVFFLLRVGRKSGFHPSAAVSRDLEKRAASCHLHQIEKKQKKKLSG